MDNQCTFLIKIRGAANESDINLLAPRELKVRHSSSRDTLLVVPSDQSGLLGVLSYLHGLGFEFLSIIRLDVPRVEIEETRR